MTNDEMRHLMHVYETQGGDAARKLAPAYGMNPAYVKDYAKRRGVRVPKRGPPKRSRDSIDPRWRWAIERGPILWP